MKKSVMILTLLGFLVLNAIMLGLDSNTDENQKDNLVMSGNTPPIYIDATSISQGWDDCPWINGTGTVSNPYILQNLIIDAGGITSGIIIKNSRAYFTIKNCTVKNTDSYSCAGIYLDNCTRTNIIKYNCSNILGYGIYLYMCNNITIDDSYIYNAYKDGVRLEYSHNCTIKHNRITECYSDQILLYLSNENTVSDNYLDAESKYETYWPSNIRVSNSNFNNFTNNTGRYSGYGIDFTKCHDNIIENNTLYDNRGDALYFDGSHDNFIIGNNCTTSRTGIWLNFNSYNNSLIGNNVSKNTGGIIVKDSPKTTLINNYLTDYGIQLKNDSLSQYFTHTIESNFLDGDLIRVYENQTSVSIPANTGQVILINCSGLSIKDSTDELFYSLYFVNNTLIDNCKSTGIDLFQSYRCNLTHNTFTRFKEYAYGISIDHSDENIVSFNDLRYLHSIRNIYLNLADHNTISYNNCSHSRSGGIYLVDSSYNNVSRNTCYNITDYDWGMIRLYGVCNYNRIVYNNVSRGDSYGINYAGSWNLIAYNNITDNQEQGILSQTPYNEIIGNYCKNNSVGIQVQPEYTNVTGNYCWSNRGHGISALSADHVNITNNYCWLNDESGIYLMYSDFSTVDHNTCYNNDYYGILVYAVDGYNWIIENNLYGNIQRQMVYDGVNEGSEGDKIIGNTIVGMVGRTAVEIRDIYKAMVIGNDITLFDIYGLQIINCNFSTISNNLCKSNIGNEGIRLESSDNCTLSRNNCSLTGIGIGLYLGSLNNTIDNNNCSKTSNGIYLTEGSNNATISNNIIYDCISTALQISDSNGHKINSNQLIHAPWGLYLTSTQFNTCNDNNCTLNTNTGIYLSTTANNNYFTRNWAYDNTVADLNNLGSNNIFVDNYIGDGPFAIFEVNQSTIIENQYVQFTDKTIKGTGPFTYNWSFGDSSDNETVNHNPIHQYTSVDDFEVTLWVKDSLGVVSIYKMTIMVVEDLFPTASFIQNGTQILTGQYIQFTSTSSGGNPSLRYQWNFDDGMGNVSTANPLRHFTAPDIYIVTLTVNDSNGDISVFQRMITVQDDTEPIASFSSNYTIAIQINQYIQFTSTSTGGNYGLQYQWYFDDETDNETDANPLHQFTEEGYYLVLMMVNDSDGDIDMASLLIQVTTPILNHNPVITGGDSIHYQTGTQDNVISFTITDTDVSNPYYRVTRNGAPLGGNIPWTSGGEIQLNVDGLAAGTYTYVITAYDGLGGQASKIIMVTVDPAFDPILLIIILAAIASVVVLIAVKIVPKKRILTKKR